MIDIQGLLHDVHDFMSTMYIVEDHFGLIPEKDHRVTCIDFQDVEEIVEQFVEELVETVVPWVYSDSSIEAIFERLKPDSASNERDAERRAWARVARQAKRRFRTGSLRGQFSELILANLLQHFFHAAPLLRKMPITTSRHVERFGADAIHIARSSDHYRLYLGEAKTYNRAGGGFRNALKAAIDDAVNLHRPNMWREISAVSFQEGVPEELEEVGNAWIDGELRDVEVHIVCIATYQRDAATVGANRQQCLEQVLDGIRAEVDRIRVNALVNTVPEALHPRLNYVLFPLSDMDAVLDAFKRELQTA